MIRRAASLALAALTLATAGPAMAAGRPCDRACLKGVVDAYLAALLKHDPSAAPMAAKVRFTENLKDAKLGDGLWKGANKVTSYRQDFLDVREGVAGSHVILEEAGSPVLLVLRLRVKDRKITEVETQVTRNQAEGIIFQLDGLKAPRYVMSYRPKPNERNTREELIKAASAYPAGLQSGSFETAPFPDDAYRLENGRMMAGPACTRDAGCKVMRTQKIGGGRAGFQQRLVLVDEENQVVWYRMSWGRDPTPRPAEAAAGATPAAGGPPAASPAAAPAAARPPRPARATPSEPTRLVVWEAFKVWGGEVHAVEAFMRSEPFASTSGWD